MEKKMKMQDWADPPYTVPEGCTYEEGKALETQSYIQRAAYYRQFENSQDMASWCERRALVALPERGKPN